MRQHHCLRPRFQTLALCLAGLATLAAVPLAAQSHHFVYLSTAAANAISGFELNPASATLTQIAGSPFNEPLGPGALALHPSGRFLYVMNAGANRVSAFAVNAVTGVLSAAPASPFAVGAAGYTPKLFLVEPSGKFLYVVSTLNDVQGTITSICYYSIDQATGALNPTPADTFSLGFFTPAGLVSKPEGNFIYLAGTASPTSNSIVSVRTIELDPATGAVFNVYPLSGQGQFARSLAISPNGQFLFVGRGQSAGSVDTYTISAAGIPQYSNNTFPIPDPLALPHALAVNASGSYLYAAVARLGVLGFSINSGTGVLTALPGPIVSDSAVSPSSVLVADPVAQFLYYEQRPFGISGQGALNELPASPLTVGGSVTGIAAANPLDAVAPVPAPLAALAPLSLQFSDQNVGSASQPRQVSLSNTGTAPLILSSIALTGINSPDFGLTHDCFAVVLPGDGCTIVITFEPRFDGARQAALTVVDNAIGSPHTLALTGAGRLPFTIQLDSSAGTVTVGQMAQYNLQLVPAPGFVGQVLLACSGAPAGAVCDVPTPLVLNGATPTPFSVRVPTTARSDVLPLARRFHPGVGNENSRGLLVWGAVLTLVFLTLRRLKSVSAATLGPQFKIHCAIVLLLVWVSLGLVSCTGAASGGTSNSKDSAGSTGTTSSSQAPSLPVAAGTPAGQYILTLTASSGSAERSVPLPLAVQ